MKWDETSSADHPTNVRQSNETHSTVQPDTDVLRTKWLTRTTQPHSDRVFQLPLVMYRERYEWRRPVYSFLVILCDRRWNCSLNVELVWFVLPWCSHDVEIRKKKKYFTVRFRTTWNTKALCVFWSRHDSMGGRDTYVPVLAQKYVRHDSIWNSAR